MMSEREWMVLRVNSARLKMEKKINRVAYVGTKTSESSVGPATYL
jgi:hypothetical protein